MKAIGGGLTNAADQAYLNALAKHIQGYDPERTLDQLEKFAFGTALSGVGGHGQQPADPQSLCANFDPEKSDKGGKPYLELEPNSGGQTGGSSRKSEPPDARLRNATEDEKASETSNSINYDLPDGDSTTPKSDKRDAPRAVQAALLKMQTGFANIDVHVIRTNQGLPRIEYDYAGNLKNFF